MSRRVSRFGLVFLGIFVGILAGISLVFWLNYIGWDLSRLSNFFSGEKEHNISKVSLRFAEAEKIDLNQKKKPNKYLHHKIDSLSSDTTNLSLDEFLAYYGDEYPDSVLIDAYYLSAENKAKDVVVAKDELLFIKQIKVSGLSDKSGNNDLDSLLLDDRGLKAQKKNIVKVEFWKSPINYQGYKWDTRKLVLFGFYEFDYIKLKYFDGNYYMQYGTLFYHLDLSDTFKSLSLTDDNDLVKELNNL
jgi:hypothetical protein